jgi:hypothetical protein
MATLRLRLFRIFSSLALLLAATGFAPADDPDSPLDTRDVEIAVYVRRALMQDPELARLNLGVSVRYNHATVSGDIPSRELADQVLHIVENVKGVYQVKDAMRVVDDEKEKAVQELAAGLEKGFFLPDLFNAPEPPSQRPVEITTALPDPRAWEQPSAPVVVLLPPVPVTPAPTTRTPANTLSVPREEEKVDLAAMIERLKFAEERYRDVRVEISAGRVTLSGRVDSAEHLIDLGRAVSQLPGVGYVDLRGVEVAR